MDLKGYIWSIALCNAETWTRPETYQKHLSSFEMWRLTDRVKNDEVLHEVQKEREGLPTIKRRKTNCIGDMFVGHVIEGKTRNDRSEVKTRKKV